MSKPFPCFCTRTSVCIRMITYSYLCCQQRTYLFVSSNCPISEIRVNGEVIANPGTLRFGGWPASPPTMNIDGDDVPAVTLATESCCPSLTSPVTATPYIISTAAPNCIYNVEVDSCGETYTCSLQFCLQRTVRLFDMVFPGYENTDTCTKETDLGTSTFTITNDLDGFTIPDFQIDYCIPDEDFTEISIGSWGAVLTSYREVGLNISSGSTTYSGTLKLFIASRERCVNVPDHTMYLMFSGTITNVNTNIFGTTTTTDTVTDFIVAVVRASRCPSTGDPDGLFVTWIFCNSLFDTGGDSLFCDCGGNITSTIGLHSWC